MGRRKIEIQPILEERNRSVTFFKRKGGLFKKAYELSVLCQVKIAVIILDSENTAHEFSSCDIEELLKDYNNINAECDKQVNSFSKLDNSKICHIKKEGENENTSSLNIENDDRLADKLFIEERIDENAFDSELNEINLLSQQEIPTNTNMCINNTSLNNIRKRSLPTESEVGYLDKNLNKFTYGKSDCDLPGFFQPYKPLAINPNLNTKYRPPNIQYFPLQYDFKQLNDYSLNISKSIYMERKNNEDVYLNQSTTNGVHVKPDDIYLESITFE